MQMLAGQPQNLATPGITAPFFSGVLCRALTQFPRTGRPRGMQGARRLGEAGASSAGAPRIEPSALTSGDAHHTATQACPARATELLSALEAVETDDDAAAVVARVLVQVDEMEPPAIAALSDVVCSGAYGGDSHSREREGGRHGESSRSAAHHRLLPRLCALLSSSSPEASQQTLMLMAHLSTSEVNPRAPAAAIAMKACGVVEPTARHLFSDALRAVALASAVLAKYPCGARTLDCLRIACDAYVEKRLAYVPHLRHIVLCSQARCSSPCTASRRATPT